MSTKPVIDAETETLLNQLKAYLTNYNKLSESCFIDCAHDLTTRKLTEVETSCTLNCASKMLKMSQRLSQRFQEFQMLNSPEMEALTKKL